MLEEPNFRPNIANPFDRDILSAVLGTDPEILPFQSHSGKEQKSDLSYPPQRLNYFHEEVNSPFPILQTNKIFPLAPPFSRGAGGGSQTREKSQDSSSLTDFNSGVFTVDKTGKILIEYLLDGIGNKGELARFSLEGIEELALTDCKEFLKEAAILDTGRKCVF
jgi:hypothetical protein